MLTHPFFPPPQPHQHGFIPPPGWWDPKNHPHPHLNPHPHHHPYPHPHHRGALPHHVIILSIVMMCIAVIIQGVGLKFMHILAHAVVLGLFAGMFMKVAHHILHRFHHRHHPLDPFGRHHSGIWHQCPFVPQSFPEEVSESSGRWSKQDKGRSVLFPDDRRSPHRGALFSEFQPGPRSHHYPVPPQPENNEDERWHPYFPSHDFGYFPSPPPPPPPAFFGYPSMMQPDYAPPPPPPTPIAAPFAPWWCRRMMPTRSEDASDFLPPPFVPPFPGTGYHCPHRGRKARRRYSY